MIKQFLTRHSEKKLGREFVGKKMLTKSPPKHLHCGVQTISLQEQQQVFGQEIPQELQLCPVSERKQGGASGSQARTARTLRTEKLDKRMGPTAGSVSAQCGVLSNSLKGRTSGDSTLLPVTITTIYLLLTSRSFFIMQFVCVVLFKHGSRVIRMPSAKAKCIPKEQV